MERLQWGSVEIGEENPPTWTEPQRLGEERLKLPEALQLLE